MRGVPVAYLSVLPASAAVRKKREAHARCSLMMLPIESGCHGTRVHGRSHVVLLGIGLLQDQSISGSSWWYRLRVD